MFEWLTIATYDYQVEPGKVWTICIPVVHHARDDAHAARRASRVKLDDRAQLRRIQVVRLEMVTDYEWVGPDGAELWRAATYDLENLLDAAS